MGVWHDCYCTDEISSVEQINISMGEMWSLDKQRYVYFDIDRKSRAKTCLEYNHV